jgi:hypothetical protein
MMKTLFIGSIIFFANLEGVDAKPSRHKNVLVPSACTHNLLWDQRLTVDRLRMRTIMGGRPEFVLEYDSDISTWTMFCEANQTPHIAFSRHSQSVIDSRHIVFLED